MNLPILRLGFIDCSNTEIETFFTTVLSKRYNIIKDNISPDYIIFSDEYNGVENLKFNQKNNIKIFYTGENRRPQNYSCHYAITFDHYDIENHYRLPWYVIENWLMMEYYNMKDFYNSNRSLNDLKNKADFCGFIVSNPHGQMRNNFFHKLSEYKKIDSAGPVFNNTGHIIPRQPIDVRIKTKLDFLSTRKFSLCFENSSYPGYVTEKLPNAYYMKTIPIYWGAADVTTDFNPKAFLNWHDYLDDDKFIKKIIELDNDDEQYLEMYMQPLYHNGKSNRYEDLDRFLDWFDKNIYKGELNN
jgi:hypothetical protein